MGAYPIRIQTGLDMYQNQGRTNLVFSKPCLFLSDTRHFCHFRRFRGCEGRSPFFQWVECKFIIFAVFVKMAPFRQGTKTRFTKNTVCATLTKCLVSGVGYRKTLSTCPERTVAPDARLQTHFCGTPLWVPPFRLFRFYGGIAQYV